MVVRNQTKQTGIGQIHRIIGSHPIIILLESIRIYRLSIHPQGIVLDSRPTIFMMQNGIAKQSDIPRIDLDGFSLGWYHQRMTIGRIVGMDGMKVE